MINVLHLRKQERSARFRHVGMIVLLISLLVVAFAASIIVSINLFSRATREYREEIITKASKLAAEQIDGDRVNQWLESGADEAYIQTANLLQSICTNTPYVQYLYVYQIKPDGCHVVFDFETMSDDLHQYDEIPEVSTDTIGEIVEFDESFSDDIPTLLEGGQIDVKESHSSFGWLLTRYEPIYDSAGQCVAYVGTDISMIGVSDYNRNFAKWIAIISSAFLVTLIVIGVYSYVHTRKADEYDESERRRKEQELLFEQTAEALAGAIDAKDKYTNGHSHRVAEYSLKIAKEAGKSEEICKEVYFAALLHDVGKIGVPIEILSKKGRLTDQEFAQIKMHPVVGGQILSSIKNSPWLSIGARYHHERYNGRGYPEGLKGDEIPEIARIIAVADAYDAMTSNRSYRNAIPQHIVREEVVKGIGTQFAPEFAKIMLHMIDVDTEYQMQEKSSAAALTPTTSLRCESLYHDCSEGIAVTKKPVRVSLCSQPDEGFPEDESLPSLIVFDSLDGQVHPGEENNKDLLYYEYARIRMDGQVEERNTRKAEVQVLDQESDVEQAGFGEPEREQRYKVEAVHYGDHAMIRLSDEKRSLRIILALPDTSRFVYIALGGEHCYIHNILVENDEAEVSPEDIPRIAEEISFIKGCPQGDVPNIQVDGWRTDAIAGIPIQDGLTLAFHTMSLPTARLVWHCPFISLFSADDGRVDGANFREYMLLRLDGENWESDSHAENRLQVEQRESFKGWNVWKDENRKGMDCVVTIERDGNVITMQTENLGIAIHSVTTILDDVKDVYLALTGDQCAITNIRVLRGE